MNINQITKLLPEQIRDNILNIYSYGSVVYGTASERSDEDFIIVVEDSCELGDEWFYVGEKIDLHVYSLSRFKVKIAEHCLPFLECLFLPEYLKQERLEIKCDLNLSLLRKSASTVASNSWVKAKKKIEQGDTYLGLKSLFHSLRILDFAIQLAEWGEIKDYRRMNYIWAELRDLSSPQYLELKKQYQIIYNAKASQLRSLCPKS